MCFIFLSVKISVETIIPAIIAAEDLMESGNYTRKIRMIDSLNASLAQGILAIYASEMREKGMAFDKVG